MTYRGFEQPPQINRVRGNTGMLIQSLSLEREFEMPYVEFEAGQRQLVRGIQPRESTEPSDPIEQVRALPSEPLQALHECVSGPRADPYRMGHGRSLKLPANSSLKHPCLAARARVAWLVSPLLLAERMTEGRTNKTRVPFDCPHMD